MNFPTKWSVAAFLSLLASAALAASDAPLLSPAPSDDALPSILRAEPTLHIGDPAPKLQVAKWVQGQPVKQFEKGTAYIVEFWATWCGPCRESIPHLNETWQKYKDKNLVVIGQDCWEDDEDLVAPFLKKMGDKMTYRVALDDKAGSKKGKMADTWMEAAGQDGIPTAFIVDTHGLIAWIGHPMEMEESTLDQVLADKYDLKKAVAAAAEKKKNEARLNQLGEQLNEAVSDQNWDAAFARLADIQTIAPPEATNRLDLMRFSLYLGKKDYPAANKLAGQISDQNKDSVQLQDELAWAMITKPPAEKRDLDAAEKIATRANDAAKGENASVFDTLARLKFLRGKKEEAVAFEEKALKLADDDQKGALQRSLDSYKSGALPASD